MRTRTEDRHAGLRVIELAGPPGAGKTALLPTIQQACDAVGLRPYTVEEAARVFARRTLLGRVASRLPTVAARRALWAIYYWGSVLGALRLASRQRSLAGHVARTQWRRPAGADAGQRRVLYWFMRTAGAYAFLVRHGRPGEALIVDEGFVHRTVQLHSSAIERPDDAPVSAYIASVPRTDLVVIVHAPEHLCRQRVQARGVWQRLDHRSPAEIDRFVANAHRAIQIAAECVRSDDRAVVEIDNADDLMDAEVRLKARVQEVLGAEGSDAPVRWRPPLLRVPRRGRVLATLSARTRPRAVDTQTAEAILERYGLIATGRMREIAMGRRNHNVIIATPNGRVVLRRYRDIVATDSVHHEHEVLTELERRAFPAVRLRRTLDGATLAYDQERMYALFDFVDGYNLASTRTLRDVTRARHHATAGRTLARLHHELRDFRPVADHHLGFSPGSGLRSHDLSWHLEMAAWLPTREPAARPDAREHHLALAGMAPDIAEQLAELHATIERARLPRTMIHGDYGVHNLLFRRDGVAVVTDFELARRELRLIDLIIVLSRVTHSSGKAFLAAYRQSGDVADAEWRRLPDVWRYYRLTGAIESWHNHIVHGGVGRLVTARRRVAEAEWAAAGVASRWL